VITIADASILEGTGTALTTLTFTVSLNTVAAAPVTFTYSTADGTALAGADYVATSGTLTIPTGAQVATFSVGIVADGVDEANETFTVSLANVTGATIGNATAIGTILNDDTRTVRIERSPTDFSGDRESAVSGYTYRLTLNAPSETPLSLQYRTVAGTAVAGVDFVPVTNATVVFAPGQTTREITVFPINDSIPEPDETFDIVFSNLTGLVAAEGQSLTLTQTIVNDDTTLIIGRTGRSAVFRDIDGDLVFIQSTKPLTGFVWDLVGDGRGGEQLRSLIIPEEFSGGAVSFQVIPNSSRTPSDGKVNIGFVSSIAPELRLRVAGDVGRFDLGPEGNIGLLQITALSVGVFGLESQGESLNVPDEIRLNTLTSNFRGTLVLRVLGDVAGRIQADNVQALRVFGIVRGGEIDGLGSIYADRIGAAVIGSLFGGTAETTGLFVRTTVDTLGFTGNITGNSTDNPVEIYIGGGTPGKQALGVLAVRGSVQNALIRTGFDGTTVRPNADIGVIGIGRDWIASTLAVGTRAGEDGLYGTDDDRLNLDDVISKVAAIRIRGQILGTTPAVNATDSYGFIATQFGGFVQSFTSLGIEQLNVRQLNLGFTGDIRLIKVG
jgi:hypothetical protein